MNHARLLSRALRLFTLMLALLALSGCFRPKPATDPADALGVGKRTLGTWVIEGDELARMHPQDGRTAPRGWISPVQKLPAGGPYTVVVFLEGRATGPAASVANYTLGYEGLQSAKLPGGATLSHTLRFAEQAPDGAAGERKFSKHWVAAPLRWETDQEVALSIAIDEIRNLQPRRMTVFLRTGTGGLGMGWLTAGVPVLIGLTMIGLWFLWFRR